MRNFYFKNLKKYFSKELVALECTVTDVSYHLMTAFHSLIISFTA